MIWVCGDLWFLAELFVAPGYQGGGVGMARTFEHARKAGATIKRLITFTFNIVSQGLYIRHGCFHGYQSILSALIVTW